jgi:hypothetical protein
MCPKLCGWNDARSCIGCCTMQVFFSIGTEFRPVTFLKPISKFGAHGLLCSLSHMKSLQYGSFHNASCDPRTTRFVLRA